MARSSKKIGPVMAGLAMLVPRLCQGAPAADLVTSIPGFEDLFDSGNLTFQVYSGYLTVNLTGSGLEYESLSIHYEFHTQQGGSKEGPVAAWHQGGPGGSSVYGAWTEMGPFQLMAQGPVYNLEYAWNNVANMLYLESPAGSFISEDDQSTGFSKCFKHGSTTAEATCDWSDTTQATAYAYTLKSFFAAFPEFKANDLYLVGESYAGQYIPNIASYMLNNPTVVGKNLTGIAVGNGCFGGDETHVLCNGELAEQNDIEIYHGKALISDKLYDSIQEACYSSNAFHLETKAGCAKLLLEAEQAIGNYNIYNVYDDCNLNPSVQVKNKKKLRESMGFSTDYSAGYPWNCESDPALDAYFTRSDVQEALHLDGAGSGFSYDQSGPASITLYPTLIKNMRVLIYNGDADLCVPYLGNEQWVTSMVTSGYAEEASAWAPWYSKDSSNYAPSGYVTTYTVPDKLYTASSGPDFAFLTIRLAGHMAAQYQPAASLSFFTKFLAGDDF